MKRRIRRFLPAKNPGTIYQAIVRELQRRGKPMRWLATQVGYSEGSFHAVLKRSTTMERASQCLEVLGLMIVRGKVRRNRPEPESPQPEADR